MGASGGGGRTAPPDPGDLAGLAAVPPFDPAVHLSPYELFRRLAEGAAVVVIDLRPVTGGRGLAARSLEVRRCPAGEGLAEDLARRPEEETLLVDDDGTTATRLARVHAGLGRVRALYGGLELYDFALDPAVVGAERFLGTDPPA